MSKVYQIEVSQNKCGPKLLKELDGWKWCDSAEGSHFFKNSKTEEQLFFPVANTVVYVTDVGVKRGGCVLTGEEKIIVEPELENDGLRKALARLIVACDHPIGDPNYKWWGNLREAVSDAREALEGK